MDGRRRWTAVVALLVCGGGAGAQERVGDAEVRAAAVESLGRKMSALAEDLPAELRDWAPGPDVRSYRQVFALVAAELAWFPSEWDGTATLGAPGFQDTVRGLEEGPWSELVLALQDGAGGYAAALRDAQAIEGGGDVRFGGRTVRRSTALGQLQLDMHEHLGQLIAYSRINGLVPRWSRSR